jgi:uncharacterized RDD family membrane protein YckC
MKKATFWQRLGAYLIDLAVLAIAGGLIAAILFSIPLVIGGVTGGIDDPAAGILAMLVLILFLGSSLALQFCYFGYFWSIRGRSIGMGLMNIRVGDKHGAKLSFLMAGLRGSIGYYISSLVFYLGFLWMLFDSQQETWHDKIFGSQVWQD